MRLLLDVHTFIWWVTDSPLLSRRAHQAIVEPANDILIGIGCVWELVIKRSLGKLHFPFDLEAVIQDHDFDVLHVTFAHLRALDGLPQLHRDPFDRLLIAQSLAESLPIVANDRAFAAYGAALVW
jgi:PIN domain nuclease of toxin-antitoxin system